MKTTITIKDVAQLAGVSTTSVSLVLNNRPNNISEETKDLILKAAQDLNYIPNYFAQSLKSNTSSLIAVILPTLSNPFFASLASQLNSAAFTYDYTLLIIETQYKDDPMNQIIDTLLRFKVSGIVLIGNNFHSKIIKTILNLDIPIVTTDVKIDNIPHVLIDNQYGGEIATEYLINNGHRRIGCYTGPNGIESSNARIKGYQNILRRYHINNEYYFEGNYGLGRENEAIQYFLQNECTAIFALNDMMAYGLYKAIRKKNLSIPKDISIVGFDNISFSEVFFPELTTINQPIDEITRLIIKVLNYKIQDCTIDNSMVIKPTLIERNSVRSI